MEYAILDELQEQSESRFEEYCKKNKVELTTGIEEVTEPFTGSSASLRLFIYKNYISRSGPIDLAIVINETNRGRIGEFKLNNVECAIYPLYLAKENAFDIPPFEEPPELPDEVVEFIMEKRSLPKKPNDPNIEFDPGKHRWSGNKIAEELHMSNRTIGKYLRCRNL